MIKNNHQQIKACKKEKKMNALENGKRQMITDLEKHPFPTCSGKRTIFLATMFC